MQFVLHLILVQDCCSINQDVFALRKKMKVAINVKRSSSRFYHFTPFPEKSLMSKGCSVEGNFAVASLVAQLQSIVS